MKAITDFLSELLDDLYTIEIATVYTGADEGQGAIVSSYTRMEEGGDAIHFFDPSIFSAESRLPELHHQLVVTAAGSRKVLREILLAALK